MTIWEKLKSWLTDEQLSELEGSKEELNEVATEMDTEGSTTPQDAPKVDADETTPSEPKSETEANVEQIEPNSEVDEVSESDVNTQTGVVLEDGWLGSDGVADLEKIKDADLKKYIEGLIEKCSIAEQTETGFNPTVPSTTTGYVPGMSFEDALSLE